MIITAMPVISIARASAAVMATVDDDSMRVKLPGPSRRRQPGGALCG
jgi:hypothetical protein